MTKECLKFFRENLETKRVVSLLSFEHFDVIFYEEYKK